MVSHDEMLKIARRYDTLMAQAMMRALGFGHERPRRRERKRGNSHAERDRRRYRAMKWCFKNYGSPCR